MDRTNILILCQFLISSEDSSLELLEKILKSEYEPQEQQFYSAHKTQ